MKVSFVVGRIVRPTTGKEDDLVVADELALSGDPFDEISDHTTCFVVLGMNLVEFDRDDGTKRGVPINHCFGFESAVMINCLLNTVAYRVDGIIGADCECVATADASVPDDDDDFAHRISFDCDDSIYRRGAIESLSIYIIIISLMVYKVNI